MKQHCSSTIRSSTAKNSAIVKKTGFKKLEIWLYSKKITSAHACMEATGKYGLMLAEWLSEHGFTVSMVNPASVKGFAQSQLTRNKTDAVDAKLIAKFTQALNPEIWFPPSPEVRDLRNLVDRCENLKCMIVQETNRLELQSNDQVRSHIETHVAWLKKNFAILRELSSRKLTTILASKLRMLSYKRSQ